VAEQKKWPYIPSAVVSVGRRESNIAIAHLWTKKDFFNVVSPESYAIMGHLYEKRGINIAARNLLSNPNIRHLIVCGNDLGNSGEALLAMWSNGVDNGRNIVGVDKAVIDEFLPIDAIQRLRENVAIHDLRRFKPGEVGPAVRDYISTLPELPAWGDPEYYPPPEIAAPSTMPSEPGPHIARDKTIAKTWLKVLQQVMTFGEDVGTVYQKDSDDLHNSARDLSDLIAVVTDEDPKNPDIAEFLDFTAQDLKDYIGDFFEARRPEGEYYSYGERTFAYPNIGQILFEEYRGFIERTYGLALPEEFHFNDPGYNKELQFKVGNNRNIDQMQIMLDKLKRVRNDRGAVAVLYDPLQDNQINVGEPNWRGFRNPCDVLIQAYVKKGALELTSYFRSNDMYGAWPRNALGLRALQGWMADQLGYPVGPLTTHSMSAHIYLHSWDSAKSVLENYGGKYVFEEDHRGNMIIETDQQKGKIILTHTEPSSMTSAPLRKLEEDGLRARAAESIGMRLSALSAVSTPEHGFHLGREIGLAELALKAGIPYQHESTELILKEVIKMAEKSRRYDELVAQGIIKP
jgi:thymidylate synthase